MTMDSEVYLKDWINNFLSNPLKELNGLSPCPYAKKALADNKIKFIHSENYDYDIRQLFEYWDESTDVVVVVVNDNTSVIEFQDTVDKINNDYISKGFLCLEDHVSIKEEVSGISMNNGKYNIVLCQYLEKIVTASKQLYSKGYYNNWSKEYYDFVMSWRSESALHKDE